MKKHILFTLKALFYAFVVALAANTFTSDFSVKFYGRNLSSYLVPLWTKVDLISVGRGLILPNENTAGPKKVAMLSPWEFKEIFGNNDKVWVKYGVRNKTLLYRSDKGSTAFTTEEWIYRPTDGSSIKESVLLPSGKVVRVDLEPESLTTIVIWASVWSILYIALAFIGKSLVLSAISRCKSWYIDRRQETIWRKTLYHT
ncbi:MAG: hypothetical protein COV01_02695 [Candidatus Taylorbacteria bacterium CG10_big_fil_rev_8_21_14_0_10_41_48]|uniref:Uncharacterized protein n=1 Tax=Candidatus Taylorbacteria bacterium CG10_big_fil_rev_8_21_14_0_10_41_48 TaxID=1975024 RepID=A0A2M8LBK5_9BACT|nr:MAG: hypothetical protein COV01_02695 [Candidatus Taylorbacteria bacterium CG10_big_fil_rev_8_21_14_0_10_41_48]